MTTTKPRRPRAGQMRARVIKMADLFCGAGGTSEGADQAINARGHTASILAINHWKRATDTCKKNHPTATVLTTGIESVRPQDHYKPGELFLLWASPECTHHSVARGGKPINDQSRATAFCVLNWINALLPPVVLIENVPEFETWGPLDSKNRPIKRRRGEQFHAWIKQIEAAGYRVEWRVLCCADFGDPTTRRRLFIQAVRGQRRIAWPHPSHAEKPEGDMLRAALSPWRTAREIIDWSLEGQSIYDRKKPLSEKTMKRIIAGLEKELMKAFIIPQQTGEKRVWSCERPAPTVTSESRGVGFVDPVIIPNFGERYGQEPRTHGVDSPAPAVTSRGAGNLIEALLLKLRGSRPDHIANSTQSIDSTPPTLTTSGAHLGLIEIVIGTDHTGMAGTPSRGVDEPLTTATTIQKHGLVASTVTKYNGDHAGREDGAQRTTGPDDPIPTVTTENRFGKADAVLVQCAHGNGPDGDAGNARRTKSPDDMFPTVTGNRGEWAVAQAGLLPQQSGGVLRPVSKPAPTLATGGGIALVEAFLVKYFGTAIGSQSIDEPLGSVTVKERHALVKPILIIDGERYIFDIRFRMLQPHELAAAQGFPKDYQFTGTKTDVVKQIGNAVPCNTARALVDAVLEASGF